MAVAWLGSRDVPMERAVEEIALLLSAGRCPVFTLDTDVHGTRAAVALAERCGAAVDHVDGAALAREIALLQTRGGMVVAPGEARRRADLVVLVGALPAVHHGFVEDLLATAPDLAGVSRRSVFAIGGDDGFGATVLACPDAGLAGTVAAIRAQCAGRKSALAIGNFPAFQAALAGARFVVFVFSGHGMDLPALGMLHGLIADLNRTIRASGLHLPASESAWGGALAATWMTGFPLRTGFARGFPEYDPWRFDAARMIAEGEADLHMSIGVAPARMGPRKGMRRIALSPAAAPAAGADVSIAIGEPGADHDAVRFSVTTGTLASFSARAASDRPSAATILRAVAGRLPNGEALAC